MFGRQVRRPVRREQTLSSLEIDGERVVYLLKRSSARRSLALRVNADGLAQINAPLAMPGQRIEAFLARHADWLRAQLASRSLGVAWTGGMALPYLGEWLVLAVAPDAQDVGRVDTHLRCPEGDIGAAVTEWYRREARRVLAERLAAVCRRLDWSPPAWRLSDARTRWGSLSPKGVVSLNWRLVKAGVAEIDYVICHELAHFRHRNHSSSFWREVARLCPDHETARAALRAQSSAYFAF